MVSNVIDYRISRVVILCKDCDQDVGLYPARHKCGIPSSEAPPLPSIPKKYLSAGKTGTGTRSDNSDNNHSGESLWGKLRSIRNWKDANVEAVEDVTDNSQNSKKLWDKILALNNNTDDSDNESEKDEWEGETHISRILREYYENKGADLPDWLYDSDSKTSTQMLNDNDKNGKSDNNTSRSLQPRIYESKETSNLNNTNNNGNNNKSDNNISRGRQPRIFDSRELLTSPTSMNYPPSPIDKSWDRRDKSGDRRDKSGDRSRDRSGDRNVHPPNLYNDQYRNNIPAAPKEIDPRYNNRIIKNTLPPRPSPNVRSTSDDDGRLIHTKKSHQQLRTVHNPPHIPTNRSRSVSPNPPRSHQRQQFIPHDVRRFNHNINQYNDSRGRQGVPASGPHGPDRNNRRGDFF